MKTFFILILLPMMALAEKHLNCNFGLFNVPMLITKTQLTADLQIGKLTWAGYSAAPPKEIFNTVLEPLEKETYRFQLEEGFGDKNILIVVSTEKTADQVYTGYAENPQMPMMKKMSGTCEIKESN
ncbi:MAG: hypothetical protein V4654_04390 [Bdellovibrionota bacterium]